MKTWMILAVLAMAAVPAGAACVKDSGVLTDWGLHRQWRVQRDCAHPARPAALVALPWSDAAAGQDARSKGLEEGKDEPLVRAGMRVVVTSAGAGAAMELTGTALRAGRVGETIPVRAGWNGAMLRAVVRGPGRLEVAGGGR